MLQKPVSLDWDVGQHWCVTGPTGSGKTSFLKILAGINYTSEGEISYPILDKIIKGSDADLFISDLIAFVPQEIKIPSLYIEDLYYQRRFQAAEQDEIPTVREILEYAAEQKSVEILEAARLMNLTEMLEQPFVQLSNGQTRRLMIAIALIKRPVLLILDNPYTGLDQGARIELNDLIKKLIRSGVHIFMAAHAHELKTLDFITNRLELAPVMRIDDSNPVPKLFYDTKDFYTGTVIKMKNIKIQYGKKIILNLNEWEVRSGEKWIIKGKNGSGKSTLLSVIMADHPQAYSNEIYLFGSRRGTGESIWEIKRRIGYFSPELLRFYALHRKADEVIASGFSDILGKVAGLTEELRQKVIDIANWLGIESLLEYSMGNLSLGQQKMIFIARALIKNPELLILDEPLQGMDVEWRTHFKARISMIAQNRTILYVTHDSEEIPDGDWEFLCL